MTEQEYNSILRALWGIRNAITKHYIQDYTPGEIPNELQLPDIAEWTIEKFPYSKWEGGNLSLLMWFLNEVLLTKYYKLRTNNEPPKREDENRTDLIYETNRTIVLTDDIIQHNGFESGLQPILPEDASLEDISLALETICWFV